MNNTIKKVGDILLEIGACSPERPSTRLISSDGVRVVLADWNYTTHQVERYGGFRWMRAKWLEWDLKKVERTCILGFESKEDLRSEEKVRILLDCEGVIYLQTPPCTLQNVKTEVAKLSKQSQSSIGRDILKEWKKMECCDGLRKPLHALGNRLHGSSGKADENDVKDIKKIHIDIGALKEGCPPALIPILSSLCEECEHYIEHSGEKSLNNLREVYRDAVERFISECGLYLGVK